MINVQALVIKGPGKVFAGSAASTLRQLYTITHAAGTYTMAMTSTMASIKAYRACGDDGSTNNYAYVTSDNPSNMINKIDMTTGVEISPVSIASVFFCAAGQASTTSW